MQFPKKILALEAAGAACSAAVWSDGAVAARCFEAMSRGQSERLVPMAEEVMRQAALDYGQLDAVAVTLGPGGFTGVRIGLATARAFALALSKPVIGISSFEAVAGMVMAGPVTAGPVTAESTSHEICGDRTLVVALEAKRADLYVQAFVLQEAAAPDGAASARWCAVTEPAALMPEDLDACLPEGPLLVLGDAAGPAAGALAAAGRSVELGQGDGLADAAVVAALAAERPLPEAGAPAPAPLYLRAPDVTLPAGRPFGARPDRLRR